MILYDIRNNNYICMFELVGMCVIICMFTSTHHVFGLMFMDIFMFAFTYALHVYIHTCIHVLICISMSMLVFVLTYIYRGIHTHRDTPTPQC